MKSHRNRFSALAALFGRGRPQAKTMKTSKVFGNVAPRVEDPAAHVARVSQATGVSPEALSVFIKIGQSGAFTADASHKQFGHVKLKEVA
jgi:hypothetical protein